MTKAASPTVTHLIADDEPDMRLLVRSVLELSGHEFHVIVEAVDGAEAVERFLELQPPPIPHVVVLDGRMPKLTGLEAAAKILSVNPDQVVILFSAFLDDDVRAEAARIGVAACVSKRDLQALPQMIADVLEARSA